MPQRFFTRDIASTLAPTAGSKSVALPAGSDNSLTTNDSWSLVPDTAGGTDVAITSLAQTALQSGRFARFTSIELNAQTIAAGTWYYDHNVRFSNVNAQTHTAISVYVWRPSNSTRVGFIFDSADAIGARWNNGASQRTDPFTGSSLAIQNGDVLVIEVWYRAIQGKANSYTNTINFTDGYLDAPETLLPLLTEKERTFAWIIE